MAIPVLNSAHPVTVPSKTYDRIWVEEVVISAPDPNGDAEARVKLRRFSVAAGVAELEASPGEWVSVPDILNAAETDADLALVVNALMAYVAKVGRANDIIQ
jgi:hypothetical protein